MKDKDGPAKIISNDNIEIKDASLSKDIVHSLESFSIPSTIKNLLWIADGKYQNYNPDEDKQILFENELFRIEFSFGTEPSLLYSNLLIKPNSTINPCESIGYFPSYKELTPGQKWIYLNWLRDISKQVDIGYVFIFYYGLERHLIYGNYEEAVETILFLRQHHENSSFNVYSSNALIMASILHKDKNTLLKTLGCVGAVSYGDNLLLIAKYLMKLGLSIEEIISLSSAVGFKNKRYIKKYPDLFSQKVSSIIESEFGSDTLPFYTLNTTFEPKEGVVFANISFSSEIRSPILPSIIDNDEFKTSIYNILSTAHEAVKKQIGDMRKEGIKPSSAVPLQKDTAINVNEISVTCPYCKSLLDKAPKRKKKCQHCNKNIYVRTKQDLFDSNLLTKEDAIAVDWIKSLEVTKNEFLNKKAELEKKFNGNVKSTDVVWGLFNEHITKTTDYHSLGMIYFNMALFLYEGGGEFFKELQESAKMDLMRYGQHTQKVKILATSESCKACKKQDQKVITIEDALKEMPIPCKDCTYELSGSGNLGWCRCTYVAVIE